MNKLSDTVDRKFVEQINLSKWQVETPDGYKDIISSNKTIEYKIYKIILESGDYLECADNHILIDINGDEIFAKDSLGHLIRTKQGTSKVLSVIDTDIYENMYDLSVDSEDHTYYTNNILSHNTICTAAYFLWVVLFNKDENIAILANKAAMAREILSRIQFAYENLPFWIQQGIVEWNKGSIKLDNNSRIFTSATSPSSIRGNSCVVGDTKICILENNGDIFYRRIDSKMNICKQLLYTVYQITNKVNSKIYIGYHQTYNLDDGYMGSGTLIKQAIEKYGIQNFEKSILEIFDSKEEAEEYEAKIVNKEFTLRKDTYNLQIGGNVRIMYGENNPFYGKTHTQETRNHISIMNTGIPKPKKLIIDGDKVFGTLKEAAGYLNIDIGARQQVLLACGNPQLTIRYKDDEDQRIAEKYYIQHELDTIEFKIESSKRCKERFLNVPKQKEHKEKIGLAHTGTVKEYVGKITNKNPEKIRKTAEKHRGMKRSEETKKNIAEARNNFFSNGGSGSIKGKCKIFDKTANKILFVKLEEKEKILSENEKFTDKNICRIINSDGIIKWHIREEPLPDGWEYNVRKSPQKVKKL